MNAKHWQGSEGEVEEKNIHCFILREDLNWPMCHSNSTTCFRVDHLAEMIVYQLLFRKLFLEMQEQLHLSFVEV